MFRDFQGTAAERQLRKLPISADTAQKPLGWTFTLSFALESEAKPVLGPPDAISFVFFVLFLLVLFKVSAQVPARCILKKQRSMSSL